MILFEETMERSGAEDAGLSAPDAAIMEEKRDVGDSDTKKRR